jgi:hypothetical protein
MERPADGDERDGVEGASQGLGCDEIMMVLKALKEG